MTKISDSFALTENVPTVGNFVMCRTRNPSLIKGATFAMNNKAGMLPYLQMYLLWWVGSSFPCTLAWKNTSLWVWWYSALAFIFHPNRHCVCEHSAPAATDGRSKSASGSVNVWLALTVVHLFSPVLLLPFPARQFNRPADWVPQIQADKRHSWKAGHPGPVWRNSTIAPEKRRRREGGRGLEQGGKLWFLLFVRDAFNRWDRTVTDGSRSNSCNSGGGWTSCALDAPNFAEQL